METKIPLKRLEYTGIKAEVKKYASGNGFTLEKNFAIVPVLIKFSQRCGKFESDKDYPAYVVEAKLHKRIPYHLVFWLFNDEVDTFAQNGKVTYITTEMTTGFTWNNETYRKVIDELSNTFNFKKS